MSSLALLRTLLGWLWLNNLVLREKLDDRALPKLDDVDTDWEFDSHTYLIDLDRILVPLQLAVRLASILYALAICTKELAHKAPGFLK